MKICELCKLPARTYCESDEACLCWDCDDKVHGANFLVARHSRNLLCQTCQSVTFWKAVGVKLGRTVSVCDRCVKRGEVGEREEESKEEEVSADEEKEGDADDNHVVPWSSSTPPPPAASSSSSSSTSSQESLSGVVYESANVKSLKRTREISTDFQIDQIDLNRPYLKTQADGGDGDGDTDREAISADNDFQLRPLKDRRTETEQQFQNGSRSTKIIKSLKRFRQHSNRESEAVDAESSENRSRTI